MEAVKWQLGTLKQKESQLSNNNLFLPDLFLICEKKKEEISTSTMGCIGKIKKRDEGCTNIKRSGN